MVLNVGMVWTKVQGLDPRADLMLVGCGCKMVMDGCAKEWGGQAEKLSDDVMRSVVRTSSHSGDWQVGWGAMAGAVSQGVFKTRSMCCWNAVPLKEQGVITVS